MIAVTAGKQPISQVVVRTLSQKGHALKVLVSSDDQLQTFKKLLPEASIQYIKGSLLDVPCLDDLLEEVTTVFHLDEMVSFRPSEKSEMYRHNVKGTTNVVNVALYHQVQQMIFLSSVRAFGEKSDTPQFNESAKWVNVKSAKGYGWSKHLAEREIWRGVNEGLQSFILNVGYITDHILTDEQMKNIVGYLVHKGVYPEGRMELMESEDLMTVMLQLMTSKDGSEQYIVTNGSVTYREVIEAIVQQNGNTNPLKAVSYSEWNQKANFRRLSNWLSGSKYSAPNKLEASVLSDQRIFDNGKINASMAHQFVKKEISLEHFIAHYRSSIS
ncbi:MAG: NAD-dependent epimerase/dehydratase family protein [Bacteroidetes bacterium]|nr:NAD-dependent epimerase/dehydratase family protein [Bacteroidota bacterium]